MRLEMAVVEAVRDQVYDDVFVVETSDTPLALSLSQAEDDLVEGPWGIAEFVVDDEIGGRFFLGDLAHLISLYCAEFNWFIALRAGHGPSLLRARPALCRASV